MLSLYGWFSQIAYSIANALVKLAFLAFYLRIFPYQSVRRVLLATAAIVVCYAFAFTIAEIFICRPVDYFWRQWTADDYSGKCIDVRVPIWVYSITGIALDLFIMAIPLSQTRKLKMNWKKKLSVGLMFCVGMLYVVLLSVGAVSAVLHGGFPPSHPSVRLYILTRAVSHSITIVSVIRFVKLLGLTLEIGISTIWVLAEIWTTIEVSVGIMCACFPACRLFLVHFLPKVQRTISDRSSRYYSYRLNEIGNTGRPHGMKLSSRASATDTMEDDSTCIGTMASMTSTSHKHDSKVGQLHVINFNDDADMEVNPGTLHLDFNNSSSSTETELKDPRTTHDYHPDGGDDCV